MITLTPQQIAVATGGRLVGEPRTAVTGPVVADSREVVPGSLFAALPGGRVDGHDFAARAVASGAALVLGDRAVEGPDGPLPMVVVPDVTVALGDLARTVLAELRSTGDLRVVAVTGSVGKTTTKDLLGQLLSRLGPTVWPEASFNNEIGLPLTVLRADAATRFLVLEMGASGVGQIDYLTAIAPPDLAIVLVVGTAHLGGFGGIDAVARAKAEIVAGLVNGGTAVLNADDARVAAMAAEAPGKVVLFGEGPAAVRATRVRLDDQGRARFDLTTPDGTRPVHLRLVGRHQVHNALAAAAAGLELGLELPAVAAALSAADALSPHRMHVIERADGVTIIDDSYNANPDSMRAALEALALRSGGRRRTIAVLGEMLELGPSATEAHDAIGRLAVRLDVSQLVVVGERARAMHTGALEEKSAAQEAHLVDDLEAAAAWLDGVITPGDVVLVKSSHGAGLWHLGSSLTGGPVGEGPRTPVMAPPPEA